MHRATAPGLAAGCENKGRPLGLRLVRADGPVVMQSFSSATQEPFNTLLFEALSSHVPVRHFSWRGAMLGRYDVLHLHWPEHLTERRGALRTAARRMGYLLLLIRIRLGHAVLVRTVHNIAPHEARRGTERALVRLTNRWTDAFIKMQPDTPVPSPAPSVLILQGHYRELYADVAIPDTTPGVLLFFGNLRSYKGIPALLEAFHATTDDGLQLRLAGRAFDPRLGEAVEQACREDARISAALGWVSHAQLASEIGHAELVVLPFVEMHNSGTVLVALSLDRPVMIPRNTRTLALSAEVGCGWVHTYEPPLSAPAITAALDDLRSAPPTARPDLSGRDWKAIAAAHVAAYEQALRPGPRRNV
jgi:beta-1,4-mannosyltransferase